MAIERLANEIRLFEFAVKETRRLLKERLHKEIDELFSLSPEEKDHLKELLDMCVEKMEFEPEFSEDPFLKVSLKGRLGDRETCPMEFAMWSPSNNEASLIIRNEFDPVFERTVREFETMTGRGLMFEGALDLNNLYAILNGGDSW